MQNRTTKASNQNAAVVTQLHVATPTSRHDATDTAPKNHGEPIEHVKVQYENPLVHKVTIVVQPKMSLSVAELMCSLAAMYIIQSLHLSAHCFCS